MNKKYEFDNKSTWGEFIRAMRSGETVEIDRDIFDYFLGVLYPVAMPYPAKFNDGTERVCSFGFAEGREKITGFWGEGRGEQRRYFCRMTDQINTGG